MAPRRLLALASGAAEASGRDDFAASCRQIIAAAARESCQRAGQSCLMRMAYDTQRQEADAVLPA